jgi:preprotein translocase subunit SecG
LNDEQKIINEERYFKLRAELVESQRINSQSYDRSILAYASAGLGLSLTFLDKVIDFNSANYKVMLYLTWIFFILSIITVITSFMIGQKALKIDLDKLLFILKGKYEEYNQVNEWTKWNDRINFLSGAFFIIAIIFLVIFISLNISPRYS